MQSCSNCGSQTWDLFTMPDNSRLCDYCSDAWVDSANQPVESTPREYNDVKHFLREDFGSVAAWARICGLNPGTVAWVLSEENTRKEDAADFSATQIRVLNLLIYSGLGEYLVWDGYITKTWLKQAMAYITEEGTA